MERGCEMTEIEKLEAEQLVIQERLSAARRRATDDSLRKSFALMLQDGFPISEIVSRATGCDLDDFAERLAHLIRMYGQSGAGS